MAAKTGNASLYLRYLETGQHADFVIECQGVEFNVHRIIVCAKSDMLDRAAGGHFQVRCLTVSHYSYDWS